MNNFEKAAAFHKEGFNCCQSVFSVFAPTLGLPLENALKVASAFGGGIGGMGEACGAFTGILMALGLKYGFSTLEDKQAKDKMNRIARDAAEKFRAANGSILCRELLGCIPATPEGKAYIKEKKLSETICAEAIRSAVQIASEMLGEK